MSAFRSLANFLIMAFDFLSMGMIMGNHLFRAGVVRTETIEDKSVRSAALDDYQSEINFAIRYQEIEDLASDVDPGLRNASLDFYEKFKKKLDEKRSHQPVRMRSVLRTNDKPEDESIIKKATRKAKAKS